MLPIRGFGLAVDTSDLRHPCREMDQSLEEIGYVTLPNGLILQWGWVQTGSDGVGVITLPKPFPNRLLSISGNDWNAVDSPNRVTMVGFAYPEGIHSTTTSLQALTNRNGTGFSDAVRWMAIGF